MRTQLWMKGTIAAAALATLFSGGVARADVKLLNVSYDPTRELYQDVNAAFAQAVEGQDGPRRHDQPVARRLGQAGPRGDRRPRGRRGHAGARLRHRRDRREVGAAAGRLADAAAQQQLALTRRRSCSSCARATRSGIKDWDDLVKPGVVGDHAEPEDLGRRALELPRRLGLRASSKYGSDEARRKEFVKRSTRTCRCSTRARAARPRRSRSAASATCSSPGRTRPTCWSTSSGKDKFEIVYPSRQHPRRAAGGGGRQERRQARHPRRRRGLPRVPLHARGAGARRASTTTGRATRASRRSTRRRSRSSRLFTIDQIVRRLEERRRRPTSPTAACSTRSTKPGS